MASSGHQEGGHRFGIHQELASCRFYLRRHQPLRNVVTRESVAQVNFEQLQTEDETICK